MILFYTNEDNDSKGCCEKCFGEIKESNESNKDKKDKPKEITAEDLIARLQAPVTAEVTEELN